MRQPPRWEGPATRPATAIGLAALVLVAACGKSGGASATGGAASGPDTTLTYDDLPRPKAGLWQTTIDHGDGHPATAGACLSGQAPNIPKPPETCAHYSIRRTFAGAIVVDATCQVPMGEMVAHSVMTGDFQSEVATESQNTLTVEGEAPRTVKLRIDSHWIGPCQPGQPTDDQSSAGGTN